MATERPEYVRRFSGAEQALHWLLAVSFLTMLVTGLILYLPSLAQVAADQLGQTRKVEAEPAGKQHEECRRMHPVHSALGAREAKEPAKRNGVSYGHSSVPPMRPGRSRALPSSPAAAC